MIGARTTLDSRLLIKMMSLISLVKYVAWLAFLTDQMYVAVRFGMSGGFKRNWGSELCCLCYKTIVVDLVEQ